MGRVRAGLGVTVTVRARVRVSLGVRVRVRVRVGAATVGLLVAIAVQQRLVAVEHLPSRLTQRPRGARATPHLVRVRARARGYGL